MSSKNADAATLSQDRNRVTELVSTCVAWVRSYQAQVISAEPPMRLAPGVNALPIRGALLSEKARSQSLPHLYAWPQAGVTSERYPLMVFVMEGEVDFRIGITESMRQRSPELADDFNIQILQLPRASVLLIPPGVPFSDGRRIPHWERSGIENANSCILWCSFINRGVMLYFCTTRNSRHTASNPVFVLNPWILSFVEVLIENMKRGGGRLESVEHSLLLTLLLSIERDCRSHDDKLTEWPSTEEEHHPQTQTMSADDPAIERARQYIEMHLHLKESMNVAQIAAHAFVSTSQLNYLFRTRLGTSVMAYVEQQRIGVAKSLLRETDLSVNQISRNVGYLRPNYFARAFYKTTKQQPREYRQAQRPRR